MLIKTLSHKWGKLNLPTLLFKVGLLTLINMDSFIYLDRWNITWQSSQVTPATGASPQVANSQATLATRATTSSQAVNRQVTLVTRATTSLQAGR